ncbi:MAG: Na+:solute symporter, partial [Xanthomonadales bacterium]|nr:Na+:solute symporter [Xanthomonadales bacterium]
MQLNWVDWAIIGSFIFMSLTIGILVSRRAGGNTESFFLSGRNLPWWLLGTSMVATTFSTDTPNLVTNIVRTNGVSGNWVWWAFLLTGMLTAFVYARLWRKSSVMTDLEFYEIRYSGRVAGFLRGFRAIYLGLFFNMMIMAAVTLAMIKIGAVILGLTALQTVLIAGVVTAIFSAAGGFLGVILTDLILFVVSMTGAVVAAVVAVNHPEVGGLNELLVHPNVVGKLSILPDFSNTELVMAVFIIPLAVQWWSVWYPGSEPGGGGYVAQRMLAAKNENHAIGAVAFFQFCHYALRPWPWIVVALASLVIFPDLDALRQAFPDMSESVIGHDLAYPAMLTFLPHGLLGLVIASLISAYMSTMSSQVNWGASYVVNDFYRRFIRPEASEKELVLAARLTTVLLMVIACTFALYLQNALQAFSILLTIGAGTGLLFILRWFWWRINAWSEISAMVISFVFALYFNFADLPGWSDWQKLLAGVVFTTIGWLTVTLVTPATHPKILRGFVRLVQPGGRGWRKVKEEARIDGEDLGSSAEKDHLPVALLNVLLASIAVYGALFAIGYG